jgi:Arc/MetJ-type ribon-helix-helix transcriptional regulator
VRGKIYIPMHHNIIRCPPMSRIETSRTIQIAVRLRKDQVEALDKAIELGIFENRTKAIRDAIDLLLVMLFSSASGLSTVYKDLAKKGNEVTPRDLYRAWFQKGMDENSSLNRTFLTYYAYYLDSLILKNALAFVNRPEEFSEFRKTLLQISSKLLKEKFDALLEFPEDFLPEEEGDKEGARPMSRSPPEDSER